MRPSIPSLRSLAAAAMTALAIAATASSLAAIQVQQLTHPLPDGTITGFSDPVWFPDGNTMMVVGYYPDFVDPSMGTLEVNLNGEIQPYRGLGIGGRGVSHPTLDPSGDRLACYAYIHLVATGLFVTHRGSTDLPTLLAGDAREPAWSPDGNWLLATTSQGLRMLSPTFVGLSQVVTQDPDDFTPAWSPDGARIAYSSTQGGTRDLWIKNLPDGPVRRLMADAADDRQPGWSPDGSWIAFCSNRGDGTFRIWVIAATGGTPVQVTEGRSPAWSPDGQSIAFARGAYFSMSQVWIATDLPDWRLPVTPLSWSEVKDKYRR